MKEIKNIKEQLISQVQSQMSDLKKVDAQELGAVIDMIKDLAQTEYYCEIYDQMKKQDQQEKYYMGRMYYPDQSSSSNNGGGNNSQNSSTRSSYYTPYQPNPYYGYEEEPYYDKDFIFQHLRDEREGRSPTRRKMYMEKKSSGSSDAMKELENYMQDLTSDMMELLDRATPEEKSIVQKKINTLATKIQNVQN